MKSKRVCIENVQEQYGKVNIIMKEYLTEVGLRGKNALRFTLLAEEALRLIKSIVDKDAVVEMWFEGDKRVSNICLRTKTKLDLNNQEKLISVSSSGKNSASGSFIEQLKSLFVNPGQADWSLAEYEAELMMKRQEDQYSEEAWDNLERSLLANLADDISVSVKDDSVLMVIRKDFTESLKTIGSRRPVITTNQIYINNENRSLDTMINKVDDCVEELELSGKDSIHARLLFEETVGMLKAMTQDFSALVWAEKYPGECAVKLIAKSKMNIEKKADLLEASSNKKNSLAKGFMGKISDIIETGALSFENAMELQDQYGVSPVNFGTMGVYSDMGIVGDMDMAGGVMWSLGDYRSSLEEENVEDNESAKLAWDELEKSIVASVAKDVIVGVKKNHIEITIIMNIEEE